MKKKLIKLTQDLVKIKSISSRIEELNQIIDFVSDYFSDSHWLTIKQFIFNNKPSIIISNHDWLENDVVMSWHLDVVPAGDDQFLGILAENKIFWRGAGDMKSGVAIMMYLMKELGDMKISQKVSLILTTDEEIWWFDGTEQLIKMWYRWDYILIPDSGTPINEIILKEKGILWLTVSAVWIACHSSRPREGKNAIEKILTFYHKIKKLLQNDDKLFQTENHRSTSVNLNVIEWGTALNTLPAAAQAKIDIRFTEEHKNLNHVKKIVEKVAIECECEIIWSLEAEMLFTDENDPQLQKYLQISKEILGDYCFFSQEHWGSDGRFFSEAGWKVILQKPTSWNTHGQEERVDTNDFEKLYSIYKNFILNYSRSN